MTTPAALIQTPVVIPSMELLQADIDQLVPQCERVVITDLATHEAASGLHALLGNLSKKIDERRKNLKEPHLSAGKAVDNDHNPLKKQVDAGRKIVGDKVGAYSRELERIERERLAKEQERLAKKAEEAEKAGKTEAADAALEQAASAPTVPVKAPPVRSTYGKTSQRENPPTITVDDIDKVPSHFLLPREVNKKAILASYATMLAANSDPDNIKCPGITFTRNWTTVS